MDPEAHVFYQEDPEYPQFMPRRLEDEQCLMDDAIVDAGRIRPKLFLDLSKVVRNPDERATPVGTPRGIRGRSPTESASVDSPGMSPPRVKDSDTRDDSAEVLSPSARISDVRMNEEYDVDLVADQRVKSDLIMSAGNDDKADQDLMAAGEPNDCDSAPLRKKGELSLRKPCLPSVPEGETINEDSYHCVVGADNSQFGGASIEVHHSATAYSDHGSSVGSLKESQLPTTRLPEHESDKVKPVGADKENNNPVQVHLQEENEEFVKNVNEAYEECEPNASEEYEQHPYVPDEDAAQKEADEEAAEQEAKMAANRKKFQESLNRFAAKMPVEQAPVEETPVEETPVEEADEPEPEDACEPVVTEADRKAANRMKFEESMKRFAARTAEPAREVVEEDAPEPAEREVDPMDHPLDVRDKASGKTPEQLAQDKYLAAYTEETKEARREAGWNHAKGRYDKDATLIVSKLEGIPIIGPDARLDTMVNAKMNQPAAITKNMAQVRAVVNPPALSADPTQKEREKKRESDHVIRQMGMDLTDKQRLEVKPALAAELGDQPAPIKERACQIENGGMSTDEKLALTSVFLERILRDARIDVAEDLFLDRDVGREEYLHHKKQARSDYLRMMASKKMKDEYAAKRTSKQIARGYGEDCEEATDDVKARLIDLGKHFKEFNPAYPMYKRYWAPTCELYVGQMAEGVPEGFGFKTTNGTQYCGFYKRGVPSGRGTFRRGTAYYKGGWLEGECEGWGIMVNEGYQYNGNWSRGVKLGYGVERYSNGSMYKGMWTNSMKCGHGKFFFSNGDTYVGDFEKDAMHGIGEYIWADGNRYSGSFKNENRDGFGRLLFSNGIEFHGHFKVGHKYGIGSMVWADGRRLVGNYNQGCLHGTVYSIYPTTKTGLFIHKRATFVNGTRSTPWALSSEADMMTDIGRYEELVLMHVPLPLRGGQRTRDIALSDFPVEKPVSAMDGCATVQAPDPLTRNRRAVTSAPESATQQPISQPIVQAQLVHTVERERISPVIRPWRKRDRFRQIVSSLLCRSNREVFL